jgi:hypothetical protein
MALAASLAGSPSESGFEGWVRTELASGKETIVLPKGTHHAYAHNASQRTLFLANNNDGMKQILFDLSGRDGLVIDGNGAEIIFHGHIIPFYMREARNITIKNLTIDYAYPFFSQGTIIKAGDGYFDVRFDEMYPVGIRESRLVFLNPDLPEPMDFNNINIINPERGRLVYKSYDEYGVGRNHTAELLGDQVVRIHSPEIRSPLEPGHVAVFQYNTRSSPAIVAHRSENLNLRNLTLYHAAAFGGLFEGSRDIYIEGWQVIRRPGSGRWFTAHHDVTHFVECRGDIHITNSRFEFQGDDDVNIHGIYRIVSRKNAPRMLTTRLSHYQQMGVDTLYRGDTIGFHDARTLELLGVGQLAGFMDDDVGQEDLLIFEEDLPDLNWENVVVTPRLHDTSVVISGNHFSNHRARNLLIKTLGKVRIFDNYLNAQGTAIMTRIDASSWYEAGAVEDVEVYNNIIDQNNSGGFSRATFEIGATLRDQSSEIPIHKNVRIHNNKIIQIFKPLMILDHVETIEFYDNEIVQGTDYPQWHKGRNDPGNVVIGPGVVKGRFQELDD